MGAELFVPRRRAGATADESIGAFMTRRFGREATTYLAEPLLAGIHAGDVDRLSLRALFPRFADAEQNARQPDSRLSPPGGDASRGWRVQVAARRSERDGPRARQHAARRQPCTTNAVVTRIGRSARTAGFRVETAERHRRTTVAALVLSTPAYVTGALVRDHDAELARRCAEIPYSSIATVALAFPREAVEHPLNGSGYVVPRTEGSGILAATWLSSKWPHRAPEGKVLLRTFLGGVARSRGARAAGLPSSSARSLAAIRPVLGIRGDPLFARVYRFDRASAQHEVGHLDRLAAIDRLLAAHPGLFLTGSGFRGVGIPDCVADARATAVKVADWLKTATHYHERSRKDKRRSR